MLTERKLAKKKKADVCSGAITIIFLKILLHAVFVVFAFLYPYMNSPLMHSNPKTTRARTMQEEKRQAREEEERKRKQEEAAAARAKAAKTEGATLKKEVKDLVKTKEKAVKDLERELVLAQKQHADSKEGAAVKKANEAKRLRAASQKVLTHAALSFGPSMKLLGTSLPSPGPADWGPGELLRLYDTCNSFSKALGLTPFAVEDLTAALSYRKGETVLVTSLGVAMLKAVLAPRSQLRGDSLAEVGRKPSTVKLLQEPLQLDDDDEYVERLPHPVPAASITPLLWQEVLTHVLMRSQPAQALLNTAPFPARANATAADASSSSLRTLWDDHLSRASCLKAGLLALRTVDLHALPVEQKLALLGTLSVVCFESGAIADEMANRGEQKADLERARREAELEENRRKRDERAQVREEAIEVLKEEKKKEDERKAVELAAKEKEKGSMEGFLVKSADGKGSSNSLMSMMSSTGSKKGKGPSKSPPPGATSSSAAAADESQQAEGTGEDGKGKKAAPKVWMPSNMAINQKMKELEDEALFGDIIERPLEDLGLGKGEDAVGAAQRELEAARAAEAAANVQEDEALEQMKFSRTQLLQRRKDKEDLLRTCRQTVKAAEVAVEQRANGAATLRELQAALDSEGGADVRTAAKVSALLKKGREVGGLEGEFPKTGEMWCVPVMKALRRKLHALKEAEKRARVAGEWSAKINGLMVRREPLATPKAPLQLSTGHQDVVVSFWSFGAGSPPVGGRAKDYQRVSGRLWAMVHSPLPSSSTAVPPLLQTRWSCLETPEALRDFFAAIPVDGPSDCPMLSLSDKLAAEFVSALQEAAYAEEGSDDETEWQVDNPWVGRRVKCTYMVAATKSKVGHAAVNTGVITGWLPAEVNEGLALWHVKHDDNDSEDLEENEAEEALRRWEESDEKTKYDVKAAAKASGVAMDLSDNEEEDEEAPWRKYVNKMLPVKERCTSEAHLGLAALRSKVLEFEDMCAMGIKAKEKANNTDAGWSNGRGSGRADWRASVESSASVAELGECLVTFEELLRGFQTVEDLSEGDDKRKQMTKEGWLFGTGISLDGKPDEPSDPSTEAVEQPHPLVGRMARRFIHGSAVDGKIVAYIPANAETEDCALWNLVHYDGDDEDLEEAEAAEAVRAFEENDEEGEDEDEEAAAAAEGGGFGLEDTEEEDDDDDDEDDTETSDTLWPTWGARDEWRSEVRNAKTIAQLALAEEQFRYRAEKFGIADLDVRSKEAKQLEMAGGRRKSIGAALQRQGQQFGGYGGRAAARDASAKISQMTRREHYGDDSDDEAPKRRAPKAVSPKKKRGGSRRR